MQLEFSNLESLEEGLGAVSPCFIKDDGALLHGARLQTKSFTSRVVPKCSKNRTLASSFVKQQRKRKIKGYFHEIFSFFLVSPQNSGRKKALPAVFRTLDNFHTW